MTWMKVTFASVGVCCLLASQALGQYWVRPAPDYTLSQRPVPYLAAEERTAPSPSDVVPRQPSDVVAPVPDRDLFPSDEASKSLDGHGTRCWARRWGCGGSGLLDSFWCPECCRVENMGEPFRLFDGPCAEQRHIQGGGWLAQSFVWNPYSPVDRFNGPVTWTDRANDYELNELYAYIGRAANTEGCGWDYGYRADVMWGTNYRWCTAAGLENSKNSDQFYGFAVPQLYAEVAYNNLTVRMGHFISPVGYYTLGTAQNFFPFLPYTYQYGEPFTHTGLLATYKFGDHLSWGNGFVRGWDNFDSTGNPNLSYITTVTWTFDNEDTLAYVGLYGCEPSFDATTDGFTPRYLQTLVYQHKFSENVLGVLQSDFGTQDNATATGGTANWYGVNSYLYWRQTCRLQWGLNLEWFRDEDGVRVGKLLPSLGSPDARGWAVGPGFAGDFVSFAVGPKYFFTPNIYGRAALRCDWYTGDRAAGAMPFDDGTKDHQEIVVFDMVCTF